MREIFAYAEALESALMPLMTKRSVIAVIDEHEEELYGPQTIIEWARAELPDVCVDEAYRLIHLGYSTAEDAFERYGLERIHCEVQGRAIDWALAHLEDELDREFDRVEA